MKIDLELIRKKSEHNEGLLEDLEEIALHQLQITKIECLNIYCKNLKILLLQNNLIDKIENMKQLKKLEYLNLSINNIRLIENLEKCESLRKLDLTLNFISIYSIKKSIENLEENKNLRELYLIGNPCCKWNMLRYFVIFKLPFLESLNGEEIGQSERIRAKQIHAEVLKSLQQSIDNNDPEEEKETLDSIERRKEIYEEMEKDEKKTRTDEKEQNKDYDEPTSIYTETGEIRQCNEGHYKYMLDEFSSIKYTYLRLFLPKHLCNSLIKIDTETNYFRCIANKKVFQLKLHETVLPDTSKITRKKSTGEISVKIKKQSYRKNKIIDCEYMKTKDLDMEDSNDLFSSYCFTSHDLCYKRDSSSSSSSSSSFSSSTFSSSNYKIQKSGLPIVSRTKDVPKTFSNGKNSNTSYITNDAIPSLEHLGGVFI